jgi:hypothetical protein
VEKGVIHMPLLRNIAGAVVGEAIGRKRGRGLLGAGLGLVASRIATRSLPGALLVGGAIVAKTLYDRRKGKQTKAAKDMIIDQ